MLIHTHCGRDPTKHSTNTRYRVNITLAELGTERAQFHVSVNRAVAHLQER